MAGFQKMIDMARSTDDIKKDMAIPAPVAEKASGPMYPYGLCISLDDETLKKLGIDGDMPDVGDMIHLMAMAKVTCASATQRENTDGTTEECRRIELQITHLGLEDEDREAEPRGKKWYGGGDDEEAA